MIIKNKDKRKLKIILGKLIQKFCENTNEPILQNQGWKINKIPKLNNNILKDKLSYEDSINIII